METNYLKSIQAFIILIFCFGLFSCQSNSTSTTQNTEVDTTEIKENNMTEEKQATEISFMISNVEDEINGNQSTIKATINGQTKDVAKATNCNEVEKEEYDSRNIPSDALWACSCWWAGAGNDFYAKKVENKVEVYKKDLYEEISPEDEKWELIQTLE